MMNALIKCKKAYGIFILSVLSLSVNHSVLAFPKDTSIGVQDVLIQKPALTDSIIGEALTGWIYTGPEFVEQVGIFTQFGIKIIAPMANMTYSEGADTYTVYALNGDSGIGFVLSTASYDCFFLLCGDDSSVNGYEPRGPFPQNRGNDEQIFRGAAIGDPIDANNVKYAYNIKFIAISDNIAPGPISISSQLIGYGMIPPDTPNIFLNGLSVTYEKKACVASVSPPVISMGVISASQFTNSIGSTVSGNLPATISLQCQDGLGVYAMMTDQNSPANASDTLTLSPSSNAVAEGVGVQFVRSSDNSVVTYGPSSSYFDPTSLIQWKVKDKADTNNNFSFTLTPQYIQTATTITPGDANAMASITFAYE
jgi:type 1 fimbria pilin